MMWKNSSVNLMGNSTMDNKRHSPIPLLCEGGKIYIDINDVKNTYPLEDKMKWELNANIISILMRRVDELEESELESLDYSFFRLFELELKTVYHSEHYGTTRVSSLYYKGEDVGFVVDCPLKIYICMSSQYSLLLHYFKYINNSQLYDKVLSKTKLIPFQTKFEINMKVNI